MVAPIDPGFWALCASLATGGLATVGGFVLMDYRARVIKVEGTIEAIRSELQQTNLRLAVVGERLDAQLGINREMVRLLNVLVGEVRAGDS